MREHDALAKSPSSLTAHEFQKVICGSTILSSIRTLLAMLHLVNVIQNVSRMATNRLLIKRCSVVEKVV